MTELRPYPFDQLVRRSLLELEREQKLFDLPLASGYFGDTELDFSVQMHGSRASSPLGPAAGPHTQMAQNIVLSWLAGCRVMELKTVQVNDRLQIPRPCIDMATVGYNVEWSQELRVWESLEEYVKASMLIEVLQVSGLVPLTPGFADTLFDLSLGYDLEGIRSSRVQGFIDSMMDATEVIERLRPKLPAEYRHLDFQTRISDQVTLSTFHGCPSDEIEGIARHLIEDKGLHTIVKLNPTLLGPDRVQQVLHERLGYSEERVPQAAFDEDTHWEEMTSFCERLGILASDRNLGFGVKFTNTLIVENHRDFFPASEERMYLSGPPLHVLAMCLVDDFREHFGMRFPVSFSAGIDRHNFPDAAALGLLPVTTCSDLLKTGGYRRGEKYYQSLAGRMAAVNATDLEEFAILAYGLGSQALSALGQLEPRRRADCEAALTASGDLRAAAGDALFESWVREARRLGTRHYVERLLDDERYSRGRNDRPPKKIDSALETFDCIACDKCVPVCPNGANFSFRLGPLEVPIVKLLSDGEGWVVREEGQLSIGQEVQYANFADFCNDCGNCDVFCPEDGGPYMIKPRFFRTVEDWREFADLDGFALDSEAAPATLHGRFGGRAFLLSTEGERLRFGGPGFELSLDPRHPELNCEGWADEEVDLTYLRLLMLVRESVYEADQLNYLSSMETSR